jgi:hypothetical protein
MKLTGTKQIVDTLSRAGVAQYLVPLGLMEITFAGLFVYQKTMRAGFLLLSCYFAGALATELSHQTPLNALLPIILIWIAALLRDKSVFYGFPPTPASH